MNNALWLLTEGDHVFLRIETEKGWVDLIKERIDGPISHMIEPSGINTAINESLKQTQQ